MDSILAKINRGKNITDVLMEMLINQKLNELKKVKKTLNAGDLEERLDTIESSFEFNKEKYDYLFELNGKDLKIQKKFLNMVTYIDEKALSDYNTLVTLLTTAVMLVKLENHPELLTEEELFLVSSSMVSVPLDNYQLYGEILIDRRVINAINSKTSDIDEQRQICYEILDYCDFFKGEDLSDKNYNIVIDDVLKLIDSKFKNKFAR